MNYKRFILDILLMFSYVNCSTSADCKVSINDPTAAGDFTKSFIREMASYKPIDELFDVSIGVAKISDIYYDLVYGFGSVFGISDIDSAKYANDVRTAMRKTIGLMTPCQFSEAYGMSIAWNLIDANLMTSANVDEYAKHYVEVTKNAFKTVNCRTKYNCLGAGYTTFLHSYGLMANEKYKNVVDNYDNALYLVSRADSKHV